MALVIELSPEIEARLLAAAAAKGEDVQTYATQLLQQSVQFGPRKPPQSPEQIRRFLDDLAQFSHPKPAQFSREEIYEDRD